MPRVATHFNIQDSRISTQVVIQAVPATVTADAAATYTIAQLQTGLIERSGPTAGRTDTLPTPAQICEGYGISQPCYFDFRVRNASGQTVTLAAGAGGTTNGTLTVATVNEAVFRIKVTNATPGSEAYVLQGVSRVAY